ncbi:hypothetical protein L1987_07844 [Smallanthus sonchifolius]|uniref:Uncharacterized protein n=1 Tax=Smallanthus sonchifolius TaxID=185202 RepID=A0ACB9JIK4_9ASTR|nr:hypothetical protein L1987_07844 [Smallanthus sonchifolius]
MLEKLLSWQPSFSSIPPLVKLAESSYFEIISQDADKFVNGVEYTLKSLEMGAVDILIVWENLDINRYVLKNNTTVRPAINPLSCAGAGGWCPEPASGHSLSSLPLFPVSYEGNGLLVGVSTTTQKLTLVQAAADHLHLLFFM